MTVVLSIISLFSPPSSPRTFYGAPALSQVQTWAEGCS